MITDPHVDDMDVAFMVDAGDRPDEVIANNTAAVIDQSNKAEAEATGESVDSRQFNRMLNNNFELFQQAQALLNAVAGIPDHLQDADEDSVDNEDE